MKTGIIRRIDDLGRVVIPKETRKLLGIQEGDSLEISLDANKVVFQLYFPICDRAEHIKRIAQLLEQDEFVYKSEYSEGISKAISALNEAYNVLCLSIKNDVHKKMKTRHVFGDVLRNNRQ